MLEMSYQVSVGQERNDVQCSFRRTPDDASPPQTIISVPVHICRVAVAREAGCRLSDIVVHVSVLGS